jgi:polysaccharide biosynthesis protein PslH
MKLLYVATHIADANGTGVQKRTAQFVRSLAKAGALTVMVSDLPPHQSFDAPQAERIVRDDHLDARLAQRNANRLGRMLAPLTWASDFKPDYDGAAVRAAVAPLADMVFDAVVLSHLQAARWWDHIGALVKARRVFVDFDDIPSVLLERQRAEDGTVSPGLALLRWRQAKQVRAFEDAQLRSNRHVLVCSRADRAALLARVPSAQVHVVPNGIAVPAPLPQQRYQGGACQLLFVAALGYAPNVQGLQWFMSEVWPQLPSGAFALTIAGRAPPPDILALGALPHVRVCADVPDLAPLYAQADVTLAPILFGGGTRIKILEAMAQGRAMVSTRIGAEGLEAEDGKELLLADDPAAFAAALMQLAANPEQRARLAEAAYQFVSARYAYPALESALASLVATQ